MRNPLNNRTFRELKSNAGKYIGLLCIILTVIMIGSAFMVCLDGTSYSLSKSDEINLTEDGYFETFFPVKAETTDWFKDNNINLVENFYKTIDNYDDHATILVFNNRTQIDIPILIENGNYVVTSENDWSHVPALKNDEIALDRVFAKANGLNFGDTVTLYGISYKIAAFTAFPDYTSLFKSNKDLLMNTTDFGIAMLSEEGYDRLPGDIQTLRYSYRFEKQLSKAETDDLNKEILNRLVSGGEAVSEFLPRESNQSISFLATDMGKDGPTVEIFIFLLLVIVAFVFAIIVTNMVEKEASVIGTLRSLGFTRWEMVLHYLRPTIIVTFVAAIVGNLLGYTVMIKPFLDMYTTSYCIPPMVISFSFKAVLVTTVVPIVTMLVINVLVLSNKLSLSPLKFLRKDLKHGKQKKAMKLPDWSFLTRFRIRVILQNMGSYLILFIGIFLSGLLLVFGLGLGPLMDNYVDGIDKSLPYEYQYVLKAVPGDVGGEKVTMQPVETHFDFAKKDIEISFIGVDEDSEIFSNFKKSDNKSELVITSPLAKKLKLKIGDTLTVTDTYNKKDYTFTVKDIAEYDAAMGAIFTRSLLNELIDKEPDYYNSLVSNTKLDVPDAYIAKFITRSDMLGAAKQMLSSFDVIIKLFNVFSVAIALILMYILTNTVIEKNSLYISYMKVFGYDEKEVSRLYLRATTITVMVALFISLPLQALSFKAMMDVISSMIDGYISFYIPIKVYVEIILIGALSYFAINRFNYGKVKKIKMSDALKTRE